VIEDSEKSRATQLSLLALAFSFYRLTYSPVHQTKLFRIGYISALALLQLTFCRSAAAQAAAGLKDAVVLVIRHAEKPQEGKELSPEGVERAKAYVQYFQSFQVNGKPIKPDAMFAAKDSKNSVRPRLTLEPLSRGLNSPLNCDFKDKDPETLARELESKPHGKNILICWHRGKIPELLQDLGANPEALLPDGKWPDNVFDWVIELRYDHQGRLIPSESKRINEDIKH
jgi:hypothetical protein